MPKYKSSYTIETTRFKPEGGCFTWNILRIYATNRLQNIRQRDCSPPTDVRKIIIFYVCTAESYEPKNAT